VNKPPHRCKQVHTEVWWLAYKVPETWHWAFVAQCPAPELLYRHWATGSMEPDVNSDPPPLRQVMHANMHFVNIPSHQEEVPTHNCQLVGSTMPPDNSTGL
jgi:hypothetical protein